MESSQRFSNYIIPTKRDSDTQNRDFIPQCKELRSFQWRYWEMKSFEKIFNLNGAKSKSMFRACGHLNKSIKITLSLKDSYQKCHRSHLEINHDEKGRKWMIIHISEKDGKPLLEKSFLPLSPTTHQPQQKTNCQIFLKIDVWYGYIFKKGRIVRM